MKGIVEFDYDKIMREKVAVNCKTEEQANTLLKWADSKGLKWNSGEKYLEGDWRWTVSKQNTCYNLFKGIYVSLNERLGYAILSYEEALLPQYDKTEVITNSENENHLEWIYDRLIKVHNENPNTDYMLKFKDIINAINTLRN